MAELLFRGSQKIQDNIDIAILIFHNTFVCSDTFQSTSSDKRTFLGLRKSTFIIILHNFPVINIAIHTKILTPILGLTIIIVNPRIGVRINMYYTRKLHK